MNVLRVCPCVLCEIDAKKGSPLALATWAADGMFWAPWRRNVEHDGAGFVKTRAEASAFGQRHADLLRRNRFFRLELLDKAEADAIRGQRLSNAPVASL